MTLASPHRQVQVSSPRRLGAPVHRHPATTVAAAVLGALTAALAAVLVWLAGDVASSWSSLTPFERPIGVAMIVPVAVLTVAAALGTAASAFWYRSPR